MISDIHSVTYDDGKRVQKYTVNAGQVNRVSMNDGFVRVDFGYGYPTLIPMHRVYDVELIKENE